MITSVLNNQVFNVKNFKYWQSCTTHWIALGCESGQSSHTIIKRKCKSTSHANYRCAIYMDNVIVKIINFYVVFRRFITLQQPTSLSWLTICHDTSLVEITQHSRHYTRVSRLTKHILVYTPFALGSQRKLRNSSNIRYTQIKASGYN